MSKTGFTLLLALLSLNLPLRSAIAQEAQATETTLSMQNESGVRQFFRLSLKDGIASLNGVTLPDSAVALNRRSIALAFTSADSALPRTCATGVFAHTVTHFGKTSLERGCMEEPRFGSLLSAFRGLLPQSR